MSPSPRRPPKPMERIAEDLKETIMRRTEVDKLVLRVRQEFGAKR